MKCKVCGYETGESGLCPECGFQHVAVVGEMDAELKAKFENVIDMKRKQLFQGIKVYVRAYFWKEQDGKLVSTAHEDILIGQNLEQMRPEQVSWNTMALAKHTAGESVTLTVVVENASGSQTQTVEVIAPDTENMWKAGFVLKPGVKAAIRVGDENQYSDSALFSLKG